MVSTDLDTCTKNKAPLLCHVGATITLVPVKTKALGQGHAKGRRFCQLFEQHLRKHLRQLAGLTRALSKDLGFHPFTSSAIINLLNDGQYV